MKFVQLMLSLLVAGAPMYGQMVGTEKPVTIKKVRIGMDLTEARTILAGLLQEGWKVGEPGKTATILSGYCNGDLHVLKLSNSSSDPYRPNVEVSALGALGFAIQDKRHFYSGYLSGDQATGKVTRIAMDGALTDSRYGSSAIEIDDFVGQFRGNFNLPELNWVIGGWTYASPFGYRITILKDKFIEIIKDEATPERDGQGHPKINFD